MELGALPPLNMFTNYSCFLGDNIKFIGSDQSEMDSVNNTNEMHFILPMVGTVR
jgi:hypothetical protein